MKKGSRSRFQRLSPKPIPKPRNADISAKFLKKVKNRISIARYRMTNSSRKSERKLTPKMRSPGFTPGNNGEVLEASSPAGVISARLHRFFPAPNPRCGPAALSPQSIGAHPHPLAYIGARRPLLTSVLRSALMSAEEQRLSQTLPFQAIVVALAAVAVHLRGLGVPFLAWDDTYYATQSLRTQQPGLPGFLNLWSSLAHPKIGRDIVEEALGGADRWRWGARLLKWERGLPIYVSAQSGLAPVRSARTRGKALGECRARPVRSTAAGPATTGSVRQGSIEGLRSSVI